MPHSWMSLTVLPFREKPQDPTRSVGGVQGIREDGGEWTCYVEITVPVLLTEVSAALTDALLVLHSHLDCACVLGDYPQHAPSTPTGVLTCSHAPKKKDTARGVLETC